MASSKCIHKNRRLVLMLGHCEAEAHKKNHNHNHRNNKKKAPVVRTAANAYLFEFGCIDENGFRIPMTVNRGIDYHMDLGGLGPACFAVEEFNKRKKTQLQFVRLQRTWMKPLFHCECIYELILEAVDAAGVVNIYLAYVQLNDMKERGMWLEQFHIFRHTGFPSKLYHYLGNDCIRIFIYSINVMHIAWLHYIYH
uniref:uncharacterized protein LOC105350721 isoform X1 n=1 Tax=Fragaria vesca subsp. vesca TaxID=101020 RepID=UPI0005CA8A22|nr:PREDICTED: uncharacterized protein LOC105350721 isoform X1 [Fragaria vesca subsp. vesca]